MTISMSDIVLKQSLYILVTGKVPSNPKMTKSLFVTRHVSAVSKTKEEYFIIWKTERDMEIFYEDSTCNNRY